MVPAICEVINTGQHRQMCCFLELYIQTIYKCKNNNRIEFVTCYLIMW